MKTIFHWLRDGAMLVAGSAAIAMTGLIGAQAQGLSNTEWLPFGPAAISTPKVGKGFAAGRVEAAAGDPTNADIMFIAADNGGVWKTGNWTNTDGSPIWIPLTDGQR